MGLIREMLGELVVSDVVGLTKRRHGRERDGGYVLVDGVPCGRVYSFGVGADASFELALAREHDVPVYLYDPSIRRPPVDHPRFVFERRGLGLDLAHRRWLRELVGVTEAALYLAYPLIGLKPWSLRHRLAPYHPNATLTACLARHGDLARRDVVLKLDVEGAEFDALNATPSEVLACCSQIALEAHELGSLQPARQLAMLRHLNKTHALVHVHFNNNSDLRLIDELRVPSVLEMTWLRRDPGIVLVPSRTRFPSPIDRPNLPDKPDPPLDFWPFAPV